MKRQLLILTALFFTFSLLMALGIFWRAEALPLSTDTSDVNLSSVLFWQLLIWAIWIPLIIGIKQILFFVQKNLHEKLHFYAIIVLVSAIAISLHYGWFVAISDLISPYKEFPDTRFGVFRYFFIFWLLIDAIILIGCVSLILAQLYIMDIKNSKQPVKSESSEYLSIKVGNNQQLLLKSQINWVEADDYYAKLHTNDSVHLVRLSLSKLVQELPLNQFVRVHRSTIVNLGFVDKLFEEKSKKVVLLKDGTHRDISKSGLTEIKNLLK